MRRSPYLDNDGFISYMPIDVDNVDDALEHANSKKHDSRIDSFHDMEIDSDNDTTKVDFDNKLWWFTGGDLKLQKCFGFY